MKKLIGIFLSSVYQLALRLSQGYYRAFPSRVRKVNARVISIGNITWGGTGKTPLVAKLAHDLSGYGKRVAILTRGYGGDEVAELKKKCPHVPILVGRDRVKTAREAVEKFNAEVVILDDGFQHLRLHRDLDVVTINATLPFGPGGLLPWGTMREPVEHLLRAQVFILTKSDIGSKNLPWIRQKLLSIRPDALILEAVHKALFYRDPFRERWYSMPETKGKKVATLSGIADPFSFEKAVENTGAEIVFAARFDDHHRYTPKELENFLRQSADIGAQYVITTEKDFCRMGPLLKELAGKFPSDFHWFVLEIEFQVNDEEAFIRRCIDTPDS